jgi:hypothetical protein
MLSYSLHENPLTERPDDYEAQTHASAVYTREQFINLMLQRGTLVTKTDVVAVLNNLEETAMYVIENGGQLNLPLFNTSFSISGVFNSILDTFDPSRHKLHVTIHNGTLLHEAEKNIRPSKVNTPSPQPQILEVKDSVSGEVDTVLTSRGAVEINGINIKITGSDNATGLFFVADDGTETKAETIIQNKPATVIALIPGLDGGKYHIKIATQFSGSNELRTPKITIYGKELEVV